MKNEAWIARRMASPAARKAYEEERLIVHVFERVAEAMEAKGLSKADLAAALETSRAHITQLFGGQGNATLRTVADLAWACDARVTMTFEPLRQGEFIDAPAHVMPRGGTRIHLPAAAPPTTAGADFTMAA